MSNNKREHQDCSDCHAYHCDGRNSAFPAFCPTTAAGEMQLERIKSLYKDDPLISKLYALSSEVEGLHYGKLTRAEEIVLYAKKLDIKKIGIAACMGSMAETIVFTRILRAKGIADYHCVCCKAGSISKDEVGIPEAHKVNPGRFEAACNPVLQAEILNEAGTGLNILIGLCVGHDALFTMHSKAPCVTFTVKDRVLQHNPVAAIYGANSYYSRLLRQDDVV